MEMKIALVLAGCGSMDGSEITEAVSLLMALSEKSCTYDVFAPNRPQHHVMNHLAKQESSGESRNMLVEAARIARGNIRPLHELNPNMYAGLLFSGGYGVAKNLCNYAFAGESATLASDVREILLPFLKEKKPVGALCIAPVLVALGAKELGKKIRITLGKGDAHDVISHIEKWGMLHECCDNGVACIDHENKIVSAPAYMISHATPYDILRSAQAVVSGMLQLM